MRNDVKTLIDALTTERNAIDRAIAGLKNMSDMKTEAPAPAAKRTKTRRTRTFLSDETKQQIVAAMRGAEYGNLRSAANRCAREFGGSPNTIYLGWQRWSRVTNRAADIIEPATATDVAEANGNLAAVQ